MEDEKSTCFDLYGPYPSDLPIPFVADITDEGRNGAVPDETVLEKAKSQFDLPPDLRDIKTPDEWVPRDGRLVRLTGKHPFNCEPPLDVLDKFSFITPTSLHYVRNHGAVPKITWEDHRVFVGGNVTVPLELTMDDLMQFQPRELPVTLVCAGNRRKEQNMIRQTIGFHWGAAGVSTNVWKGVLLRDILLRAGVDESNPNQHVEFIGTEDLPNKVGPGPFNWGKTVKYGTSMPLARAMNPAYDVLLAYQANGKLLQPDHGYPVRMIIPGYIGGRMIKWLVYINVLSHETHNHYHYHDNRILPPHVTAEIAQKESWWYRPEYIFNELNINSAIAYPNHKEKVLLRDVVLNRQLTLRGYAYSGGGRAITRVEISTTRGIHWDLATIHRVEKPTPYGMYWCWIWWTFDLPMAELIGAKEIWCRAWDASNNTQPVEPTWNLMGMGNNPVFKVKVQVEGAYMWFENPTQPGQQTGGWMTRLADKPESAGFGRLLDVLDLATSQDAVPTTTANKDSGSKFTLSEVQKHNNEKDCWIIIKNRVYDATEYLELHPGGIESITINAGADATEDFVAIHSIKATKMLEKYYIGDLDTSSLSDGVKETKVDDLIDEHGRKLALNPRKKTPFRLQNKVQLSRDTILLDFALPTPKHILGLPTGKHMFLSAQIGGEPVLRRYTPISSNYDIGCVKFVIKVYTPCERFPEGGKMSQYVDMLKIGDYLNMRGPVGEFEYTKKGNFLIENVPHHANKFNMIAGGTGITPVMQIAAEILRHPDDPTEMSLIFACRVEGDLLMRSTLDEWATAFQDKFKVHYILSDEWPDDWKYSTGFVDKALFENHLFPPGDDVFNLACGPPIMLDKGVFPNLEALGHKKKCSFAF